MILIIDANLLNGLIRFMTKLFFHIRQQSCKVRLYVQINCFLLLLGHIFEVRDFIFLRCFEPSESSLPVFVLCASVTEWLIFTLASFFHTLVHYFLAFDVVAI